MRVSTTQFMTTMAEIEAFAEIMNVTPGRLRPILAKAEKALTDRRTNPPGPPGPPTPPTP